jgi:hypothetical protein
MDIQNVKLSDVVGFRPSELSDEEWSRIESAEGVRGLNLPGDWAGVRNQILMKAGGLLDITLLDVMRSAWKKGRELEAYRDTEKYPLNKTFTVPLVEHKITSTHKPRVDIQINGKTVGSVHFTVNIEIAVKGMTLEIRNARITKIHAGDCKAKGSFFCEGFLLAERATQPLELPGTIDLDEGLEI